MQLSRAALGLANLMSIEILTITGAIVFGRMWWKTILRRPLPMTMAAST